MARTEEDARQITREETFGTAALWFALLAGPTAWFTQVTVNYLIEEWIACTPGATFSGEIWGIGIRTWMFGITAFLVATTLAALAVSIVARRRLRNRDATTGRRASWMAYAGIINSVIFLFPLATGFVPILALPACLPAPP